MITQGQERQIQRSGLMGERQYGIALSPKIYSIMSDRLYTDRVGSVVREVCSNAWDAQKMRSIATGQPMEPFKVTLPTDLEPHFIVEDSGPGMPDEAAQDLYSTLGLSTKENTNDQIGAFGLGSKSPFAVTDTFTVENTYEGVTHHYLCFKAESGLPSLLKTGETKDNRPNGVKVMVPASGSKYMEYKKALNRQLIVMDPKPLIVNIETFTFSDAQKAIETEEGFIISNAKDFGLIIRNIYARMGMVLYPVDVSQLDLEYGEKFHDKIGPDSSLVLEFSIGDLEPLPSREGLTYDQRTIANIGSKYREFAKSYKQILRKTVEEQPNPLEAWRKMQSFRESMNMDLSHERIYNLGFVIDNNQFQNAFPYFDHHYVDKKAKIVPFVYDEEGNEIEKPVEYEEINKITSVSQFYYERFTNGDTRLNIKRDPFPMKMSFSTLNSIEKGNIKILVMDELDPKYRVGRMKSVLKGLGWRNEYWVVRVDQRYHGDKDKFEEFFKCFEMLHRGITKNFILFSQVPKPEVVRKKREDNSIIDGVALYGANNTRYEIDVRWSDVDKWMSPLEVYDPEDEDIPEDYEEQCQKAKDAFLSSHFYVLAERNDLTEYTRTSMRDFLEFSKNFGYNCFIIRKTGLSKLKQFKELGLKEFKEFLNDKLDGHEVSEDFKKYSSARKITKEYISWFRSGIKYHLESIHKYLKGESAFIHPFFKEHESVIRLSSTTLNFDDDPKTKLINALRNNQYIQYFQQYKWSEISEIDFTKEFGELVESFERFYPAFAIIARASDIHYNNEAVAANPILIQYILDYNSLRGKDVQIEEFENSVIQQQTDEVKETEEYENV